MAPFRGAASLLLYLVVIHAVAAADVFLSFSPADPPLARVRPSYLSVNVDAGTLYHDGGSWRDAPLIALVRALARAAPTQLRIGGGAADNLLFTGVGGARGTCSIPSLPSITTCVSASLWDDLLFFAQETGVELVFDLNGALRESATAPWDSANAEALLAYAASAASRGLGAPAAFQLGNEPEDWYKRHPPLNISGSSLAGDYQTLRTLIRRAGLSSHINGPDACCEDRRPLLADFAAHVGDALDGVTVHSYPLPRLANNSCIPSAYTSKAAMLSLRTALSQYAALAAPVLERVPLILGETATSAHGGCANLSNRFVSGFTFMLELGSVGEWGVVQLNRQDLFGYSSEMEPSLYSLLGPPGWAGGGVPLGTPHPDFFTALFWKQLMGTSVLNSSSSSPDVEVEEGVDLHVWCGRGGGGGSVVSYFSLLSTPTTLHLPDGISSVPRTEFILTSSAAGSSIETLFDDAIFLNGIQLESRGDGSLIPPLPFAGVVVTDAATPVLLPPLSYGFFVLSTHITACEGRRV